MQLFFFAKFLIPMRIQQDLSTVIFMIPGGKLTIIIILFD